MNMVIRPHAQAPSATVTLRHIWQARQRISHIVKKTPLIEAPALSERVGAPVHLKLENLNVTGSFKIRGAANKILSLTSEERRRGITTFSTGNFGRSVAFLAKELGIQAVICISKRVPDAKVAALEQTGARIERVGHCQDDAEQRAYQLEEERGLTVIHPFDDPYVIAGQGTIGLELLDDLPDVDTVIAGLSGGGLLSGLGVALKSADPGSRVIGISAARGAAMAESIKAGKPVTVPERDTLADSLLGGIGETNRYTFDLVRQVADEIALLEEDDFAAGMAYMLDRHRMVIEGAAAAGIGALLKRSVRLGSQIAVIVSGSSVDTSVIVDIANRYRGRSKSR